MKMQTLKAKLLPHSRHLQTIVLASVLVLFGLALSFTFIIDKPILFIAAIPGVIGLVLIFQYPILGFYLTVASIPLDEVGDLGKILPMINISIVKIFALLTLASWFLNIFLKKMRLVWCREMNFFLLYYIIGILSLFDALDVKRGLQELVILGTTILFVIMTFNIVRTKKQVVIALLCLTTVSAGTFAYAGIQRLLPSSEIAERVGWLEEGEAAAGVEISNIESKNLGKTVRRSTGTTAHSNVLGANTALAVPVILALMLSTSVYWLRLLGLIGIGCCAVGVIVSLSRTGILSWILVASMLFLARFYVITAPRILFLFIAAAVSIPFLPDGVARIFDISNYFGSNSVSVSERYKLWDAALRAFINNPLTGFGLGDNRGIFEYYHNPWNPGLLTVHNTYLQVLIETGIFGLMVLVLFFYKLLKLFWRTRITFQTLNDRTGFLLITAIMISTLAFFLMGAIAFDFMRIGFKNMWVLMGLGIVLHFVSRDAWVKHKKNA